ncbi:MAG: prepilin peptidase [Rhodobacteraceae bacterium]|nr:prepilin peptidase [Paracoccaceae bacterium]
MSLTDIVLADGVASLVFLVLMAPVCIWVAWSDMKSMRIPNAAVVATFALFVLSGPFVLPLQEYGWRFAHLAVVLLAGFVLNMIGQVGAGDAKFAAAMAPFVALADAFAVLFIFAAMLLAAFSTHRLFRRLPFARALGPDWRSWDIPKDFPMGFALSGTLLAYLGLGAARLL